MSSVLGSRYAELPLRRALMKLDRHVKAEDGIVTVFRDGQATLRSSRREDGFTMSDQESGYQGVEPGDLVIHGLDAFAGSIGVSDARGKCSPVYHVCGVRGGGDARYIAYALRAEANAGYLTLQAGSVRQRAVDFRNWETLARIPVPWPPIPRQASIADYLDAEAARIDALTSRRTEIMALLAERRRSATDRVIAEFGGRAWPVVRLKFVIDGLIDTLHATAPEDEDGPAVIVGTGCIKGGVLDLSGARRVSLQTVAAWSARAVPRPGDVLLTREAPAGEAALVPAGIPLAPGQRVVLIRTRPDLLLPELIVRSIYSDRAAMFLEQLARETTVSHLNMADIGSIPIVLPPLALQVRVAAAIRTEIAQLDVMYSAMKKQITLLHERRQALITAAVTGQIEIPGVAA